MNNSFVAANFAPNYWTDKRINLSFIFAITLFALVISALNGKDLNWDQLNYHFYLPYSLFADRTSTDYMPANGQSYLNPLAYVPFYLMVTLNWPSLLIAFVLTIIHSLNIVLSYFILRRLLPDNDLPSLTIKLIGTALAFLSPIFLTELGTSFADISTSVLVLAAVLLGLHSTRTPRWWTHASLIAGITLGIACGLKLSNLLFGPGLYLLVICMQNNIRDCGRALTLLAIGTFTGLIATHSYWGWKLWEEFGNPFYPLFQSSFPSAAPFPPGSAHERFLADDFLDALLFPFRIVALRSWIYIENVAPDLRFAALAIVTCLAICILILKRKISAHHLISPRNRALVSLGVFFIISYLVWLKVSANGRYGLVLTILCGPVLAALSWKLLEHKRITLWALTVLIGLQILHLSNANLRWTSAKWTKTWYEVTVPKRLQDEAFLYISIGGNSNSYIYPFLAPKSAFTNPVGHISFDFDQPGGERLKELFARYKEVRAISMTRGTHMDPEYLTVWEQSVDSIVSRFGYMLDNSDCEMLSASGQAEIGQDKEANAPDLRQFRTCRLLPRPYSLAKERGRITKIVEEIVDWCPKLFKPAYTVLNQTPDGWVANYGSTDMMLVVKGNIIFARQARSSADLILGTVEGWEKGAHPECSAYPDKPRKIYTF